MYHIIAIVELRFANVGDHRLAVTPEKRGKMKIGKGLRNVAAMVLSTATLLALGVTGVSSANADDANIDVTQSPNDKGSITINNAADDHTYAALQIGKYVYAQGDASSNTVSGISVDITGDTTVDAAVTKAAQAVDSTAPADNTIGWIVKTWLDSDKGPAWGGSPTAAGNLRKFVTQLDSKDSGYLNSEIDRSSNTVTGASDQAAFTGLPVGIYVIVDTQALTSNSNEDSETIPILTGTTIGAYTKLKDVDLGVANAKLDNGLKTTKTYDGVVSGGSVRQGSVVRYHIQTSVPMWTGYSSYLFQIIDTPGAGLTLDSSSPIAVNVGGEWKGGTTPVNGGISVPASDYKVTGGTSGGNPFTVDFVNNSIEKYEVGKSIIVTYQMKITDASKSLTNKSQLKHSAKNNGDCASDPTADSCTTMTRGGGDSDADIDTYSVTIRDYRKLNNGSDASVTGAVFKVCATDGPCGADNYLKFDVSDTTTVGTPGSSVGVYTYDPDATTRSGEVTDVGPDANGAIRVAGLPTGTYKFIEDTAPTGMKQIVKPSFTVKIDSVATAGEKAKFTFTPGMWKLASVDDSAVTVTGDSEVSKNDAETQNTDFNVKVENVESVTQLPMTGGAGIILLLALIVISGSIVAGTAVLRRRNSVSHE